MTAHCLEEDIENKVGGAISSARTCSGCKMDKAAVAHQQGLKELHGRIQ
jgi:hypothetical protein